MNQYLTFKEWNSLNAPVIGEVTINLKYLVSVRYLPDNFVSISLVDGEEYNFRSSKKEFETVLNMTL